MYVGSSMVGHRVGCVSSGMFGQGGTGEGIMGYGGSE